MDRIVTRWWCPTCKAEDVTTQKEAHTRMHACASVNGLTVPMLPYGMKAKVEASERGDYLGTDIAQTDGEGRPVMNVTITRDDGNDVIVYAPTATGRAD